MATATDGGGGFLFESDPWHPERERTTPHTGNRLHNILRICILKVTPPAGPTIACYALSLLDDMKEGIEQRKTLFLPSAGIFYINYR
jgi:hypothetical protein